MVCQQNWLKKNYIFSRGASGDLSMILFERSFAVLWEFWGRAGGRKGKQEMQLKSFGGIEQDWSGYSLR